MIGIEQHDIIGTYYAMADEASREAFRNWLKGMLRVGPMKVLFVKKDGTVREINCTLEEGVVVPHQKTTDRTKEQNDEVCPVWDIDKQAWRSFRYDAVREIRIEVAVD